MRIVYFGSGDIGLPVLESLFHSKDHQLVGVVSQPDKPVGRHQELTPSPIKKRALELGLPVLQPNRMRDPEAIEALRQLSGEPIEVIVVMAYGQILPKALLDLPSVACLNLHASLLPRHRGAAPIQAAIESGDSHSGITVMYMDEGLDTGDILLMDSFPLDPKETGGSLHDRLAAAAPESLLKALDLLARAKAPRSPQESALATYAPKLTRESGVIDWNQPAEVIDRKIRAMNPWPAASTTLNCGTTSKRLKVFAAEVCKEVPASEATNATAGLANATAGLANATAEQSNAAAGQPTRGQVIQAPGQVIQANKEGILVATGKGALQITELQLEGKRRMKTHEFLLGHPLGHGTTLGQPTRAATQP